MLNEIMLILSLLSPIILLFGIIGAIYRWNKLDSLHKFIFIFFLISLAIDLLSRIMIRWLNLNSNLSLFSFYILIEYIFLAILYNYYLLTRKYKLLIYLTLIGGVIIILLSLSKLAPIIPTQYQLYEGLVANFFTILFGLFLIYHILVDDLQTSSQLRTLNNIIILYAGIQFFMSLTVNFMVNMEVELVTTFWLIRLFAIIIFYSKLAHILWQPGRTVIQ